MDKKINKILLACTGFAAFFSAIFYADSLMWLEKNLLSEPSTINASYIIELQQKNTFLEQENKKLILQLQLALTDKKVTQKNISEKPDSTSSSSTINTENKLSIEYDKEKLISIIQKSFQEKINKTTDYGNDLAMKFEQEIIDPEWSATQEDTVNNFFRGNALLANIFPESIICKTESCQIRIPAANVEDANKINMAFSQAIANHYDFAMQNFSPTINSTSGVVEIYLPKNRDNQILK